MVVLLSRRSRVGREEESEEGGRAGRGGGKQYPSPLAELRNEVPSRLADDEADDEVGFWSAKLKCRHEETLPSMKRSRLGGTNAYSRFTLRSCSSGVWGRI